MSLNNAHSVPMFYFSLEQMQKTTLPLAVDWCRNEKGADRYPFFVIRTDPLFCDMLKINKEMLPRDAEAAVTKMELSDVCPGIYRVKKTPAQNQPLDQIEAIAEHLKKMEEQQHLGEDDEKMSLELMTSRSYISKTHGFDYKEHLDFSVLDVIAQSRDDFPHGWNMENLPGKLTELLNGNNKILGVSTAMCYMGEDGTSCVIHVENYDLPSANVLLQHSAGKAWIGFNPDDERKLNAVMKKNARDTCCDSPLLHVDIMIDANPLDDLGIIWYYVIQRPGDIVITNPRGFHQVHNLGYNFAEACNFVCDGYKKIARRRKACQCPGRLSLYQDLEPWKILSDYVYEGELEMLVATDATASLPVSELQKLYEVVPQDEPWISAAAEEDEEDLGMLIDPATQFSSTVTQIHPMDFLNERIGSAIGPAAATEEDNQPMEESCDIFEESVIVLDTQTSTAKENATTDHDKESSDDEDEYVFLNEYKHSKFFFFFVIPMVLRDAIAHGHTLRTINNAIKAFQFFGPDNENPPNVISLPAHAPENGDSIKMSANQMSIFIKLLPLIFRFAGIRLRTRVWTMFMKLQRIIDILWAHKIDETTTALLDRLIQNHLKEFHDLGGNKTVKAHLALHYPRVIREMGPLRFLSSMRFEAFHQPLKLHAKVIRCHKNIPMSLSSKNSKIQAFVLHMMRKGNYVENLRSSRSRGKYKRSLAVVYGQNETTREPIFGEIQCLVGGTMLHLHCLTVEEFDEETHCFVVQGTSQTTQIAVNQLLYPDPLPIYAIDRRYIRLREHLL